MLPPIFRVMFALSLFPTSLVQHDLLLSVHFPCVQQKCSPVILTLFTLGEVVVGLWGIVALGSVLRYFICVCNAYNCWISVDIYFAIFWFAAVRESLVWLE